MTCGQCALMQHNGGVCPYFNEKFPPETNGCPKGVTFLTTCEICGRLTDTPIIDVTDENHPHMWCPSCHNLSGHCPTCIKGNECLFETDPSPIPKVVQKEIRQGNMITVTQIMNPERIRQTCQKGCTCFDPEFGCLKQNNCCGKWKVKYADN